MDCFGCREHGYQENGYQENPVEPATVALIALGTAAFVGLGVYLIMKPKAAAAALIPAPVGPPPGPLVGGTMPPGPPMFPTAPPPRVYPTAPPPTPIPQPSSWQPVQPPFVLQPNQVYRISIAPNDYGQAKLALAQAGAMWLPRVVADWPDPTEDPARYKFQAITTTTTVAAPLPTIASLRVWIWR